MALTTVGYLRDNLVLWLSCSTGKLLPYGVFPTAWVKSEQVQDCSCDETMFFDGCYCCMQKHFWLHLPVTHPVATWSLSSTLEKSSRHAQLATRKTRSQAALFGRYLALSIFWTPNSGNELKQYRKKQYCIIFSETLIVLWNSKPVFNRSTD